MGDESAAIDKCEKSVLDCLNIVVKLREKVIVDLCKSNGQKPKFEDFWQVKLHYVILFILIVFHFPEQSTVYK